MTNSKTFKEKIIDIFENAYIDDFYFIDSFQQDIKILLQLFGESFANKVLNDYKETGSCSLISDNYYQEWLYTELPEYLKTNIEEDV